MGFVGINIATHLAGSLIKSSDAAVELDAKLKLVTDSTEDFNRAQSELVEISLESGSSLEANIILFTRMNKAIKSMGGTTETTLATTRALSQGLRISGASTQESASVIRQWSQAMSSGVLRGEEFNAVSENGARIIQALSTSLGVTIGELRAMSKEGELTAQKVTEALLQQSKVLAEENAKLPLTIGRAFENVRTQWRLMMGEFQAGNAFISDIVNGIANNFTGIVSAISDAGSALLVFASAKVLGMLKQRFLEQQAGIRANSQALLEQGVIAKEKAAQERIAAAKRIVDFEKELAKRDEIAVSVMHEQAIKENMERDRVAKQAKKDAADAKRKQADLDKLKSLEAEKLAQLNLSATVSKRIVQESEQALLNAKNGIATIESNRAIIASEQAVNVQNIKSLEGLRRKQLAQLENATGVKKQIIVKEKLLITEKHLQTATSTSALLNKELTVINVELGLANSKLAASEERLTVAMKANFVAIQAKNAALVENTIATGINSAAINTNTASHVANSKAVFTSSNVVNGFGTVSAKVSNRLNQSTSKFGKFGKVIGGLNSFFTKTVSLIGRFGSALLGWPGILAFVGYEIVGHFFDWGLLVDTFVNQVERAWINVKKLFATGDLDDYYAQQLVDLDQSIADKFFAVSQGYANIEDYRKDQDKKEVEDFKNKEMELIRLLAQKDQLRSQSYKLAETKLKDHLKQMEEIEGADQASLDAAIAKAEFEAEVKAQNLEKELTDEADKQKAINEVKAEAFEEITALQDEHLIRQIDRYQAFYDEQIAITEHGTKANLELQREMHKKLKELNDQRIENAKDMVRQLSDTENDAVEAVKSAKDKIEALEKRRSDFLIKLNGDQRADWQKNLDAQKARDNISKKLREADLLDQQGKAGEAEKIRNKALDDLEDLITSEKKRGETAEKGSAAEALARSNVTNATNLYRDAVKDAISAQDEAIEKGNTIADDAKNKIDILIKQIGQFEAVSKTAQDEIANINQALSEIDEVEVSIDMSRVTDQIATIDAKIKALSQEVTVTVKTNKVSGDDTDTKQEGGLIRRAVGGFIPRSNKVPGTGSGDKVKALLEPGEFIMRKSAVQKFGESAMYAMNRGEDFARRKTGGMIDNIQRFATGGKVNSDDGYIDSLSARYLDLLDEWIKKAQQPGRGLSDLRRNKAASEVVKTIQSFIPIIPKLKGKDSQKVDDIVNTSENMLNKSQELYSFHESENYSKNLSERLRMQEVRDAMVQLLNVGGIARKFAEGGSVPGTGLGDTVKALLTPGEFVMKKGVVQQFGSDFFNSINAGIMPQRFAQGGLVGEGGASVETINLNFNLNGSEATGSFVKNDATMNLIDQLKAAEAST